MAVRIVLVGDVCHRPEAVLDGDGLVLLAVVEPARAAEVVAAERPDAVVIGVTGDAAARVVAAVSEALPAVGVLVVGGVEDHGEVLAAVRAGATGYLDRTAGPAELVAALRRTAAGEAVFSAGLAAVVLAAHGRATGPGVVSARLTDRETEVLRLVVEGFTARQIGTRLELSPRTVENHVQHILRKFDLGNRAALVRYAIENGLA